MKYWTGFQVLIFDSAGVDLDPSLATILVGIIQFFSTILSAVLVDKAGRRMLLLISGTGMAASMSALGTAFYNNQKQSTQLQSLELISHQMIELSEFHRYKTILLSADWPLVVLSI